MMVHKHYSIAVWFIAITSIILGWELIAAPANVVANSQPLGWIEFLEGVVLAFVELKRTGKL